MGLEELLTRWDYLPAAEAAARAWQTPGPERIYGSWHARAREDVHYVMPLLGRAMDRLLVDLDDVMPSTDHLLWEWPADVDRRDAVRHLRRDGRGR